MHWGAEVNIWHVGCCMGVSKPICDKPADGLLFRNKIIDKDKHRSMLIDLGVPAILNKSLGVKHNKSDEVVFQKVSAPTRVKLRDCK